MTELTAAQMAERLRNEGIGSELDDNAATLIEQQAEQIANLLEREAVANRDYVTQFQRADAAEEESVVLRGERDELAIDVAALRKMIDQAPHETTHDTPCYAGMVVFARCTCWKSKVQLDKAAWRL